MSVELNTGEIVIIHTNIFKNTVCKTWYSILIPKERCLVELVCMEQIMERIVRVKPSIFYMEEGGTVILSMPLKIIQYPWFRTFKT